MTQLKYHFIRTPLERPLMLLRHALGLPKRLRERELAAIHAEDALIDEVIARTLRPEMNCLDVGAHYGSMLSAILRAAPKGQHAAVEAIPEKAKFLRAKFPEVTIHNLALSADSGSVEFFVNTTRSGFSSMAKHGRGDFERIVVPCETLDAITAESPPIGFMKIDVEGAEEMVFQSGKAFLAQHRPLILFECGPSGAETFGRKPVDLYDLLTQELGYDVFFLKSWLEDREPSAREEFEQALVYPFKAFNWIAQHRG